ncbi:peptide/nickel transport system permease protein [Caldanaerobius fijiensis DSM 17918]|uniref:Peptide/nickel transport system permease protein n=1 Tax=Caldanaerobius fijiensis DSM 17918 TaxID=1121256 RepID=A0A1M4WIH8_9THEO|nr:ABC transporter permease [Caldanaerobius fijiensis]SHE80997.1 peptide/nickel transport system permease protein [Caldanaerobius fijiensis DSM 17918]
MSLRVLAKRVGNAIITLVLAVILTFVLLRLTPGSAIDNWARQYAIQYQVTLEEAYRRIALMINYNPKEPIPSQFVRYAKGLLHGNLGVSMIYQNRTVNDIIASALPWTTFVLTIALLISFTIGMLLGVNMAWKRSSWLEPVIAVYAILSTAIPDFIFAILLLVIFAYGLQWFPINGAYDPYVTPGFNLTFILNVLYHAALPILTYVLTNIGGWTLGMKGAAVSVLGEDYVTAARARGISDRKIMKNYVRKNAILPQITGLAISFGGMLGGSALIENSFSYPGMGYYLGQAIGQRDYTVMQGMFLFMSIVMIFANLIADLLYAKLDPRVKIEE